MCPSVECVRSYETEIFTAGSTKASRSGFVAASVAGSPFLALAGDALPSVPWADKGIELPSRPLAHWTSTYDLGPINQTSRVQPPKD